MLVMTVALIGGVVRFAVVVYADSQRISTASNCIERKQILRVVEPPAVYVDHIVRDGAGPRFALERLRVEVQMYDTPF